MAFTLAENSARITGDGWHNSLWHIHVKSREWMMWRNVMEANDARESQNNLGCKIQKMCARRTHAIQIEHISNHKFYGLNTWDLVGQAFVFALHVYYIHTGRYSNEHFLLASSINYKIDGVWLSFTSHLLSLSLSLPVAPAFNLFPSLCRVSTFAFIYAVCVASSSGVQGNLSGITLP